MKSFKVTIDGIGNDTPDSVKTVLRSDDYYGKEVIVTVEDLPTLPEVKKVETGVLMSPAERCESNHVDTITWVWRGESMQLCKDSEDIGKCLNINTSFYPRSFYRDIKTTWDFDSIEPGSLIKIEHINGEPDSDYFGRYKGNDDKHCLLHDGVIFKSNIKSIRIVELAKE